MATIEMIKQNPSYVATRLRMKTIVREFELSQKEKAEGLTENERMELGSMRIANALKDGFWG